MKLLIMQLSPVTFSVLYPKILFRSLFMKHHQSALYFLFKRETKFHTHTKCLF